MKVNKFIFISLLIAGAVASTMSISANVTLPAYLSDNMVVQQQNMLTVSGKSDRQGQVAVTASWNKKTVTGTIGADGSFAVTLPTPKAGGPHTITIDDGDRRVLRDVLVGEVWFCSGQSNMEMPVKGWGQVKNWEQELANADHPQIRLLQSKHVTALTPSDAPQVTGDGWQVCTAATVENFSSVAYFFARQLQQQLKVPIGVIDSSWGGTPAEAWTSAPTLTHVIEHQTAAQAILAAKGDRETLCRKYDRDVVEWQNTYNRADQGMQGDKPIWVDTEQTGEGWGTMQLPNAWEWQGLENFDGIVWFQKVVNLPQRWAGKELTLRVGKVDDIDITWFNGTQVGQTDGYWIVRDYKVPAHLVKAGKAIVTVKVKDGSGLGGICGDAGDLSIGIGDDRISLAGQWRWHIGVAQDDLPYRVIHPDHQNYPANLYNAMVHPFKHFNIKGVIWYQGEENASRWRGYTPLFQALIHDWRQTWRNAAMPFYFVQLAGWQEPALVQPDAAWAHLREAQANALALDHTGMAVALDIGEPYDIHPKNKQEVGRRLALAALASTYGRGHYQVPQCTGHRVEGQKMVLTFNQPISIQGEQAEGLVIAGPDMVFHPAQATVNGNQMTVWADNVAMPVAVRYGWANCPPNNLRGRDGLPVAPLRTDR